MVSNRRQSQVLFLEIKTRADNVQTCPIRIFSAVLAKSSDGHFKIESNSKNTACTKNCISGVPVC